jgi:hypothetical protein
MWWNVMYSRVTMEIFETIPEMGEEGDKGERWGGVNSTMIYCKNSTKCHNVPPVPQ